MICPHCNIGVKLDFEEGSTAYQAKKDEGTGMGYEIVWDQCPECEELIVLWRCGKYAEQKEEFYTRGLLKSVEEERTLYPKHGVRIVPPEVPEPHKEDFAEACSVLGISPKASAALSRRILQAVLEQEFGIEHGNLAKEIEDFVNKEGIPSYLTEAVDAVRNIGNFAAHPSKDRNTGEIANVEPGEAEWLLEVLEAMFDFVYVQPQKLEERRDKLNSKLEALGKSPMRGQFSNS